MDKNDVEMYILTSATLMTACECGHAVAEIEDNILKIKFNCGPEIEIRNFIGNKELNSFIKKLKLKKEIEYKYKQAKGVKS
jgi:hypothetical protein